MQSWLFQGNPRVYDIRGAMEALPRQTWSVRQSSREIRAGDEVFFWETGENGGLLGIGSIDGDPAVMPMLEGESDFVRDEASFPDDELRVVVDIVRVLREPVPKSRIQQDPRLAELRNLRFANSTNYKVTDAEAVALRDLIEHGASSARVPRVFKIAPGEEGRLWNESLSGGYAPVGWPAIGDLRDYDSFEALRADVEEHYLTRYNGNQGTVTLKAKELWLLRELQSGDLVVANRGIDEVLGVGTVKEPGLDYNSSLEYPHIVHVDWDTSLAGPIPDQRAWFARTVAELTPDQVHEILPGLAARLYDREGSKGERRYFIAMLGVEFPGTWETTKQLGQWGAQRADAIGRSVRPGDRAVIRIARQGFKATIEFTSAMREVQTTVETDPWQHPGRMYPYRFDFELLKEYEVMYNPRFPGGANEELGLKTLQMQRPVIRIESATYDRIVDELDRLNGEEPSAGPRSREFWTVAYFLARCGSEKPGRPAGPPPQMQTELWYEAYGAFYPALGGGRPAETFVNSLKNGRDSYSSYIPASGRIGWRGPASEAGDRPPAALPPLAAEVLNEWIDRSDDELWDHVKQFIVPWKPQPTPKETLEQLAGRLNLTADYVRNVDWLLRDKKQVVFYGPPGTGKTFVAEAFAAWFAGSAERVQTIQFHPSYAYEDFVEGIRPRLDTDELSYTLEPGILRSFAEAATADPDTANRYVLIIDEINRANLSRVFGELLFLLEYRKQTVTLPYSKREFGLPPNLFIIGTMNTADRSIALVDFALRRRFHFVQFPSDISVLRRWLAAHNPAMSDVAELLAWVNRQIDDPDFAIGFSYFIRDDLDEKTLELVWSHSVLPALEEFYFDDRHKRDAFALDRVRAVMKAEKEPAPAESVDAETTGPPTEGEE